MVIYQLFVYSNLYFFHRSTSSEPVSTNDPIIFNNYDVPNFLYGIGGHYAATYHKDGTVCLSGHLQKSKRYLQWLEEQIMLLKEKVAGNTCNNTETTNDGESGLLSALFSLSREHTLMILAHKLRTWTVALRHILSIVFSQQVLG